MSSLSEPVLPWSTRLAVSAVPTPSNLAGDKVLLPQSALEQLLSAAAQVPQPQEDPNDPWAQPPPHRESLLPHPLIVKLTNRRTGVDVYAVPREFSAEEGEVVISQFLGKALGLKDGDATLDIEAASLPKGTKVRLRPLEAGYDEEDWEPILERYMREGFATVSEGLVLEVPRGIGQKAAWRFLVDQAVPGGSICVVDTGKFARVSIAWNKLTVVDLEVDIEPLDEEQARETLKRRLQRSSSGGNLTPEVTIEGEVGPGDEHFYDIDAWDHAQPLEIELNEIDLEEGQDVDLFVTTDQQHHKPLMHEHIWGDMSSNFPKRIRISPGNIEMVDSKSLSITVRGWKDPDAEENGDKQGPGRRYTLRFTQTDLSDNDAPNSKLNDAAPSSDHKRCPNCHQFIPNRTFFLHESFCLRNNVVCPTCSAVFKRGTEGNHWHCEFCLASGNAPMSQAKHIATNHTPRSCPSCPYVASSMSDLAAHRTSVCPGKLILCPFCHLIIPQEGDGDGTTPDAESILKGLSKHSLACGARTTECALCPRRIRLRDMDLHLKAHELERLSKPVPTICANPDCCRSPTKDNPLGLCDFCFGPLYARVYDPTGAELHGRLERKLLLQLLQGCGKDWCRNSMCKTGRINTGKAKTTQVVGIKEALPLVKAVLEKPGGARLCVDGITQRRREMAERLEAESVVNGKEKGGYYLEFCVRAVEVTAGDEEGARRWLLKEGVRTGER
jgi:hypothetical protein